MKNLLILLGTFVASMLMFIYVKVTLPFFAMLDNADKWLIQALNFDGGFLLDNFFYLISSKKAWIPIGVAFIYFLIKDRKLRGETLFIVMAIVLTVTISDQVSSSIVKPTIERLRPSHCPKIIDELHFVNNYHSGRFGFVSSHAANATGVFFFVSLLMRRKWVTYSLLVWTVLICYSRIYLGVHYPGDVICGYLIGATTGTAVYRLYISTRKMRKRYCLKQSRHRQTIIAEASADIKSAMNN